MVSIDKLLTETADFVRSEFNLAVSESSLKYYSASQWDKFCNLNGFDKTTSGLYVPKSYTAYVHPSLTLVSDVFHEFYGHGLFCEHSILGKELVKNADSKDFLYSKSSSFGLTNMNILDYEGFAMWMESTLCKATNNGKVWDKKRNIMSEDNVRLLEYFQSCENSLSRYGFMSQMGFPKYQDSEKIVDVVRKFYGREFDNIDMILSYGSKKPYSDIDLFIVSNNPSRNYFNGWLDIYELNIKDFEYLKNNLDISVTDPIFSGTQIYGAKLEEYQRNILNLPITSEAIAHNALRSSQQREAITKTTDERLIKIATGYEKTYELNAKELSKGNKILTLKEIEKKYEYSRVYWFRNYSVLFPPILSISLPL